MARFSSVRPQIFRPKPLVRIKKKTLVPNFLGNSEIRVFNKILKVFISCVKDSKK